MNKKKKMCAGCNTEQYIWKTVGRDRYCKDCAAHLGPTKKIPTKSVKKASEDLVYSKLRVDYLTRFPVCKAALPSCTTVATDVHHKAGRGKYYLITTTWLPVCRKCHTWIENNPDGAKELGFSESRL
jgi:hypothetical protein